MSETVDSKAPEFSDSPFGPAYPSVSVCVCVCLLEGGRERGMAVLHFLCRSLLFFRARKMGLCKSHVI